MLVVWNRDGKVIKRVNSGDESNKLDGHAYTVYGIAVHPNDPRQFISYGQDFSCILHVLLNGPDGDRWQVGVDT
jgi:hypothetical protein